MNSLIKSFLAFKHHNEGAAQRTVDAYGDVLDRLGEFAKERGIDPLSASPDDLLMFTGAWLHQRYKMQARSRTPYVAAVREFYRWAFERRHIEVNPAADLPYPRHGKKLPEVMTTTFAERLLAAPDYESFKGVRDAAMMGVLMGCGLRVSGLVGLNQSQLLGYEHEGKPRLALKVLEKGDKERLQPIPVEAELMLRMYLQHEELKAIDRSLPNGDLVLFVSLRNHTCPPHEWIGERRRMNTRSVWQMIQKYGLEQGVPERLLHPHALRHLYGTSLVDEDVNQLVVQDLMGHADPKSTGVYIHLAMKKKTASVDQANPLSKMRSPVGELLNKLK